MAAASSSQGLSLTPEPVETMLEVPAGPARSLPSDSHARETALVGESE